MIRALIGLALLLLAACVAARGKGEVSAVMVLRVLVLDAGTGEPLEADVYWVPSREWRPPRIEEWQAQGVHQFTLSLGAAESGWLVVMREGYAVWRLRVRYEIATSKEMVMPVRLRRLVGNEL